jgi:crotonobetainyl-CoA:carnitine CoA-transferase CaiB-like acyl-CoA transferase
MADDPELVVKAGRLKHKERLFEVVNAAFASDTRDHWLARLRAARVPAGAVRTVAEALESPETKALDIVSHIPHPAGGTIANIRSSVTLEKTPMAEPLAAPRLGEHTREVLRDTLGYTEEHIQALKDSGVFGERLPDDVPESHEAAMQRCPFLNPQLTS